MASTSTKFTLIPVDLDPVHDELIEKLSDLLYNLPVGPRKNRDTQVRRQAIDVMKTLDDVLKKHGLEIR